MAEYTAIMIGFSVLTLLLAEIGFRTSTDGLTNYDGTIGLMHWIKILFITLSLAMGFMLIYVAMAIAAENSASASFQGAISIGYVIWGTVFFTIIAAFVIYYVWFVPTQLAEMTRRKRRGEE